MNVVEELNELYKRADEAGWSNSFTDIIAMQRGPDDPTRNQLKSLTTTPIREIAIWDGGKSRTKLTAEQMARRDELIKEILAKDEVDHFVHHYYWAVAAIRRHTGYDLLTETQEEKP